MPMIVYHPDIFIGLQAVMHTWRQNHSQNLDQHFYSYRKSQEALVLSYSRFVWPKTRTFSEKIQKIKKGGTIFWP